MSQYTVQSSNPHLNLARTTSAPPEKNLAEFSQIKELSSKLQTNDNSGFTTNAAEKVIHSIAARTLFFKNIIYSIGRRTIEIYKI